MKYMATSSVAKASARQSAAALYSESLSTRTSLVLEKAGREMVVAAEVEEEPDADVEPDEVDSVVMAAFIFSMIAKMIMHVFETLLLESTTIV